MKGFIVIDGIMEGTKFDGYILDGRYINTDTIGQSYPLENVRKNNYYLDTGFNITINDYIKSNRIYKEGLLNKTIKMKELYGHGQAGKGLEILEKRYSELLQGLKKYGNESIMKIELLHNVYLSNI